MPGLFEVNGKGVVIFSPIGILDDNMTYDSAAICCFADFDEKSCKMTMSDEYSMFDYGIDLYAPQSNTDENGRRVVIAWARMPEAVGDNENKRIGMMCIPRVVDVRNNHIYFSPHPNIRKAFSKKSGKPSHKSGYMLKTAINNGESINIGGYIIRREDDIIITDRTAVFINDKNYRLIAKTPVVKEGNRLEIYVDSNLIEIYINDGEYVLSSVVYGLSDIIEGGEYEIFVTE